MLLCHRILHRQKTRAADKEEATQRHTEATTGVYKKLDDARREDLRALASTGTLDAAPQTPTALRVVTGVEGREDLAYGGAADVDDDVGYADFSHCHVLMNEEATTLLEPPLLVADPDDWRVRALPRRLDHARYVEAGVVSATPLRMPHVPGAVFVSHDGRTIQLATAAEAMQRCRSAENSAKTGAKSGSPPKPRSTAQTYAGVISAAARSGVGLPWLVSSGQAESAGRESPPNRQVATGRRQGTSPEQSCGFTAKAPVFF